MCNLVRGLSDTADICNLARGFSDTADRQKRHQNGRCSHSTSVHAIYTYIYYIYLHVYYLSGFQLVAEKRTDAYFWALAGWPGVVLLRLYEGSVKKHSIFKALGPHSIIEAP